MNIKHNRTPDVNLSTFYPHHYDVTVTVGYTHVRGWSTNSIRAVCSCYKDTLELDMEAQLCLYF